MALENEVTRVAGGAKGALKSLIKKLGGTVGDELIDKYSGLADKVTKPDKWDKGVLLDGGALKDVNGNDIHADVKTALDIPAANDGKLTIQKNGAEVGTFSANASADKTVNITVPTKASDIGAATATDLQSTQSAVDTLSGKVGVVPADKTVVKMIEDAQAAATYDDAAVKADIKKNTDAIGVLNGSGVGSVDKKITDAFNDFATKVSDDGVVNSYKELIDWAATHGAEAATMAGEITTLKNILNGIGGTGESATVVAYVTSAIDALKIGDYAKVADLTALAKRVTAAEGKLTTLNGDEKTAGSVKKALADAKSYTDTQIKAIPTPDVSGQISTHNKDTAAHQDIRIELGKKETAGAAASVQTNLNTHTSNSNIHVTADDKAKWDDKQDQLVGKAGQFVGFDANGHAIAVEAPSTGGLYLDSISITTPATKLSYKVGEAFNSAGMVVKANYTNGVVIIARDILVTGWNVSPSGALDESCKYVTVQYTENGVTKTARQAVTVTKTVLTVPSQSGSLTYTGVAQSPSWNNYDTGKMTQGGVTSGTNAGSYNAAFTIKNTALYCWPDGSTAAKSVAWSIGKAAGASSINPTSIALNASKTSATIAVTRSGDGAVSASSNNTGVANVSVSGTTVTVTSVNGTSGNAVITISVAAGTNYTAPSNKTCSVAASFKPTASTSAAAGVSYTSGLSGVSAADVSAFAEAISNNSSITNATSTVYVDFGSVHRKISVGDQVTLPLNGTNYAFDVIGFNHDALTTPTAYGAATATGKAGITFQMHDMFATNFAMNGNKTNAGGWKSSKMRTSTMVTMQGYLPSAWQTAIKPVNKVSGTDGGSFDDTETVSDGCFLLAEVEIFGSNIHSVEGEGVQYAYYKAGNSEIKNKNGSANSWWERSRRSDDGYRFCCVYLSGGATHRIASETMGVAFCFCV